jgi:hypothetical protein
MPQLAAVFFRAFALLVFPPVASNAWTTIKDWRGGG